MSIGKVALGLALAGLLLFGQSINDSFHFDDVLIVNDSNVANPAAWQHFLNPLHLRQLTFFTFYLNHLVASDNPASYHMVNVGLHIANAILLFALLSTLLDRRMALLAAAIFLAHPIQTEPVMYVYQRSILLACFFSLLGLLAVQKERPWLALLLFGCAFESKESALAVPLLLALYSRSRRQALILVTVVVLLVVASLGLLYYRQETTVGIGAIAKVSPFAYFLTETRVVYTYLRLLVFPHPQSLEYDFPLVHSINLQVVAQILGLAAVLATGIALARTDKWRVTGLSILAFLILLAPTSTIIPSVDAAFEHRLYLPMLAFSVFLSSIIFKFRQPLWIGGLLIIPLAIATIRRGTVWASDAALWEDTVQNTPNKVRAWFNLGGAYMQTDPDRALLAYKKVLLLQPDYGEAYFNMGAIEQARKNFAPAIDDYNQAIRLNPQYWPAWNNLGNSLMGLGEKERAINAFERTLSLNPDHWPAQYNLAIVHFSSGRFDEALPRLRTVLDWRPDFRDARYLLAMCLSRMGQQEEAERELKKLGKDGAGQPPMPITIPALTR